MCKKLCFAAGAVVLGLAAIFFVPRLGSKARDVYDSFGRWANDVPVERQLADLQRDMGKIDGDIKKNLGKLASLEVEYEKLEANVAAMKDVQAKQKEDIATMTKALDSKETKVVFNGRTYSQSGLSNRLESAVNNYEIRKTEIKTKEQLLASKRQALELAHQRISEMKDQKEKLRVTVAKLEMRNEQVKLKQVDCPIEVNDSVVNKCNAKAAQIERIIAEEEKKAELFQNYGYKAEKATSVDREPKSREDVLQSARKLLQDDEDKVAVENK